MAAVITPIAAVVTAILTTVFAFLRRGDNQKRDDLACRLDDIEDNLEVVPEVYKCLQTIADGFQMNVTHEQAVNLLEMTLFETARLNVRAWVIEWFRAGQPNFGGQWDIDQTIRSEFHTTSSRLQGFMYMDTALSSLLVLGEFAYIRKELERVLPIHTNEVAAGQRVDTEFSNLYRLTLARLDEEVTND